MSSINCNNCGGKLEFSPGEQVLKCPYCEFENKIEESQSEIVEHSFDENLDSLETSASTEEVSITECAACAAQIDFSQTSAHKQCTFCGSDIKSDTQSKKIIKPESLIPFKIDNNAAMQKFKDWIKKLWFAPSALKKTAHSNKIDGAYIPFWTYDAHAEADYKGEKGTDYEETQNYTDDDGNSKTRTVTKTRWENVSGHVSNNFDDVLVSASTTIPESLEDLVTDWNLNELVSYNEKYFKGFSVEIYNRSIKDGFEKASSVMDEHMDNLAREDIGGDKQKVHNLNVDFSKITFKHILLPIWISSYRFNKKTYQFIVNGQNGSVKGERPWSVAKIIFAIFLVAAIAAGIFFAYRYFGGTA